MFLYERVRVNYTATNRAHVKLKEVLCLLKPELTVKTDMKSDEYTVDVKGVGAEKKGFEIMHHASFSCGSE